VSSKIGPRDGSMMVSRMNEGGAQTVSGQSARRSSSSWVMQYDMGRMVAQEGLGRNVSGGSIGGGDGGAEAVDARCGGACSR
jgi:hypothetical protein